MSYVSHQQNWRTGGQNRSCLEVREWSRRTEGEEGGGWRTGERGGPNNVYTFEIM
jgi:hypothetical protein